MCESTDDRLIIEADPERVLVTGRANEFEMPSEDPEAFPDIPTFADGKGYREDGKRMAAEIRAGRLFEHRGDVPAA